MDSNEENQILPDTLEKYYEEILKTALAISIIRIKPQHLRGEVFAKLLITNLTENTIHWKSKAQALEKELLLVKEELIKAKLSLHAEDGGDNTTTSMDTNEDMECLTPPSSSESKTEDLQHRNVDNDHVKFLKNIVSLWNAPQSANMLKDTRLCFDFSKTVAEAVSVLQEKVQDCFFAESDIPKCCVHSLLGVLDMKIENSEQIMKNILGFASEMILVIMNHNICNNNHTRETYSQLILQLATHKKMTTLILSKLIEQLVAFSNKLRSISQDPMLLQDNLEKYNSIFYILSCTENILLAKKGSDLLQNLSRPLMKALEDSVLHLSKSFPLITCYIWRIGGVLSTYNQSSDD